MRQFNMMIYYKNEAELERYLWKLNLGEPIFVKKFYSTTEYMYECFYILCFNRFANMRDGYYKTDLVVIENCYKNEDNFKEILNCVIEPSLISFNLPIQYFGGDE